MALNITTLGQEHSRTSSAGAESYTGGNNYMANTSHTITSSEIYFADVNGDGLPDLIIDGLVYFNRIVDGVPTFILNDSAGTPVPIDDGKIDTTQLVEDLTEVYNAILDASPLMDAVRCWQAPFAGQVAINAPVQLATLDRGDYRTADGVRVAIQQNGSELWSQSIGADDHNVYTPTGVAALTVEKGDRIYFRVSSVFDGAFDEVAWDPEITFLNVPVDLLDANGLTPYRYKASKDFVYAGRGSVVYAPSTGTLRLKGDLVKQGITSDDVRLMVYQNDTLVISRTMSWQTTGAIALDDELAVTAEDKLYFKLGADSPIDLAQISWQPEMYYTASDDLDATLTDPDGNPLAKLQVFYDADLYQFDSGDLGFWEAPQAGDIVVTPQISATGDPITDPVAGVITFTVKKTQALVAKQTLTIYNWNIQDPTPVTVAVQQGDRLYFSFSGQDPDYKLAGHVSHSVQIQYGVAAPVTAPSSFTCTTIPYPNSLPHAYRGWGYVAYNGNRDRYLLPMNESELVVNDNYGQDGVPKVFLLYPQPAQQRWVSEDDECWIGAGTSSSSRFGSNYIAMPQAAATADARGVTRIGRASQFAVSAGHKFTSVSTADGSSYSELDFVDLNGDGFPDIVGQRVQYSTMTGGLEEHSTAVNWYGKIRESKNHAAIGGIGGNPPKMMPNAFGHVGNSIKGVSKQLLESLGVNVNIVDEENNNIQRELIDLNGDGLPDQVWLEGPEDNPQIMVALNLGYSFAEPEVWGNGTIGLTKNESAPITANIGYNSGEYGFAGGTSFGKSTSHVQRQLLDINGDGLVDLLYTVTENETTKLYVSFNTGNGFTQPVEWQGAIDTKLAETSSHQSSQGLYYSIGIGFWKFSIVINPGVDRSTSLGRREASFIDANGDGLPDSVQSTADGQLKVALNRTGVTNKLKIVARPLGAIFELSYQRVGNTYDMPRSRWVLSQVVVNDGHPGNGADTQLVTFQYNGGKYDRLERGFYGFREIVAAYQDPLTNTILKTITTTSRTDSYYTKKLVESTTVTDGSGRLFVKTTNQYRLFDVETQTDLVNTYPGNTTATVFPQLMRTDKSFYEGQISPGVSTYVTYDYDKYGNVSRYFDAGNTGAADDVEADITYHEDLTGYIVGKPASTKVYGNGTLMRHREGDYDAKGNQTELRQYLADGQAQVTNFTYYANGTLQQVTGPINHNGQRYAVSFVYDPVVGTHITQITDSFGYTSLAAYNYLYGVETSATDINGNVMRREYDNFGRLSKVFSPYDGTIPAAAFAYYPDERPAKAVTQNKLYFDPANSETIDTVLFTDGLKRVVQTKKEAEVLLPGASTPAYGMNISSKTIFDALGRIVQQGQPGFAVGYATEFYDLPLKNPTATQYDVLDRKILVTLSDDSTIKTVYATENGQFKTTVTDPEGKVRHSYADVRDNSVKTVQFNNGETITTVYEYDPLSEIIKVIDNKGNIIQTTYDLVGQRISLNNPDRGLVEYTYDLAGNLVEKIDGNLRNKAQAINYVYEYNRLQKIDYPESTDVIYEYGTPGAQDNRASRISKITDASGTTESFYGKLGEAIKTVKTMNFLVPGHEPWTFTTEAGYDYLGRVQWLSYPDGEKLTYVYDQGGLIKGAYGEKQTDHYDYVKQISYDEFGQRVYIKYGNDVETRYIYNPLRRWLDNISTENSFGGTFQNSQYTFDKVGNVLGIENKAQNIVQYFQYDDLYQLTKAEGTGPDKNKTNYYIQTFSYDTISNLLRKTSYNIITPGNHMPKELNFDFTYLYSGRKPHAPSQIENWVYQYDDNGNTVVKSRLTGAPTGGSIPGGGTSGEYFWDEANRLILAKVNGMSTDFLYDAGGNRTVKRGPGGETLYVSEHYQLQNRQQVTKHFFVGTTRVVSKLSHYHNPNDLYDSGYERKNIYTYHPDHLGSSNYITDPEGKRFEHIEYTPYGETWIDEGTNLNIIDYRFTSKELDSHTGLYYYGARYLDPQNSRWLSPDPAGQGINWYVYSRNNPVNYVDPTGLFDGPLEVSTDMAALEEQFKSTHQSPFCVPPIIDDYKKYIYPAEGPYEKIKLNTTFNYVDPSLGRPVSGRNELRNLSDMDLVARTIFWEAGDEIKDPFALAAIANIINNRHSFGDYTNGADNTLRNIVLTEKQFTGLTGEWNQPNGNPNANNGFDPNSKRGKQAIQLAWQLFNDPDSIPQTPMFQAHHYTYFMAKYVFTKDADGTVRLSGEKVDYYFEYGGNGVYVPHK